MQQAFCIIDGSKKSKSVWAIAEHIYEMVNSTVSGNQMTRGRSHASNASPTAQFPVRHCYGMADSTATP